MNTNEINGIYPRNVSIFQNPKSIRVMQEVARLKKTNKQNIINHTHLKYTQGEKSITTTTIHKIQYPPVKTN